MQSISTALSTLISREQNSFQRATKVTAVRQAVNSRPTDSQQCFVDTAEQSDDAGRLNVDVGWRRRRPECSTQPSTLELYSPDTGAPWQPACTPLAQGHWANGVGHVAVLTVGGRTCGCRWRGAPPRWAHVAKCRLCTEVIRQTQRYSSPLATWWMHARASL